MARSFPILPVALGIGGALLLVYLAGPIQSSQPSGTAPQPPGVDILTFARALLAKAAIDPASVNAAQLDQIATQFETSGAPEQKALAPELHAAANAVRAAQQVLPPAPAPTTGYYPHLDPSTGAVKIIHRTMKPAKVIKRGPGWSGGAYGGGPQSYGQVGPYGQMGPIGPTGPAGPLPGIHPNDPSRYGSSTPNPWGF